MAAAIELKGVRKTFEVLRGGQVPNITFAAKGSDLKDLGRLENMVINGEIVNGEINVPKPAMSLSGMSGAVSIREGILQGTVRDGTFAGARGHDGTLTLSLSRKNRVFKLDVAVETDDIGPVNAFLRQEFKGTTLEKNIRFIEDIRGPTAGRLILGDSLDRVRATVEATDFDLRGQLENLKSPLTLKGRRFNWDGKRVELSHVNAALGDLAVDKLSGSIGLTQPYPAALAAPNWRLDYTVYWLRSSLSSSPIAATSRA